ERASRKRSIEISRRKGGSGNLSVRFGLQLSNQNSSVIRRNQLPPMVRPILAAQSQPEGIRVPRSYNVGLKFTGYLPLQLYMEEEQEEHDTSASIHRRGFRHGRRRM